MAEISDKPSDSQASETPSPAKASNQVPRGQGFRALTDRWTRERVEAILELLHKGDRAELAAYLEREVPRVPHASDPPDMLDLKGFRFDALGYRADLGQVKLEGLNLWSSRFHDVNLRAAKLTRCLLGVSTFDNVYFRDATFTDCDMYGCDFSSCNLQRVKLDKTSLRFANFEACEIDVDSFEKGLVEEQQGKWALARDVYKALRLNLTAAGDDNGASWAVYRECVMNRRDHWSKGRRLAWAWSLLLDVLWGYGQRPSRLFAFSIGLCLLYGCLYFLFGIKSGEACVYGPGAPARLEHLFDCIYYSFITFTTVGYGDFTPCTMASRALAASEAMAGTFTMGLFVTANVRKFEGK